MNAHLRDGGIMHAMGIPIPATIPAGYPVDIPSPSATAAHSESPTLGRQVIGLGVASNDYE